MSQSKKALVFGAILMVLAVGLGAFGSHMLNRLLTEYGHTNIFTTANQYHFYHSLGLLIVGIILNQFKQMRFTSVIVNLLLSGIIIFSGSLYLLAVLNITWLGAITPIGGICLLLAWGLLGISLIKLKEC